MFNRCRRHKQNSMIFWFIFVLHFPFQEVVYPVLFIAILGVIRITTAPSPLPPVPSFNSQPLSLFSPYLQGGSFLVSPNTSVIRSFISELFDELLPSIGNVSLNYFDSESDAEDFYMNASAYGSTLQYFGVSFADGNLANSSYTIRMPFSRIATSSTKYGNQGEK